MLLQHPSFLRPLGPAELGQDSVTYQPKGARDPLVKARARWQSSLDPGSTEGGDTKLHCPLSFRVTVENQVPPASVAGQVQR